MPQSGPPLIPWFESEHLDSYLNASEFDNERRAQIRAFGRDGFAVLELGDEAPNLCDRAVAETEPWLSGKTHRVQDVWLRAPAVRELALHPKIRSFLSAAYGRRPFPFQTLNFKFGSQQHPHADTIHFHSAPERFMCGVWIALEDVQPDAGPLIYYPGSHRLPIVSMDRIGVSGRPKPSDYGAFYEPHIERLMVESVAAPQKAIIPKGSAFVWAANLVHGGAPIERSGATRQSLVVHYYFDDCLYFTPLVSDMSSGRRRVRAPYDLATGWPRFSRAAGRIVWPRLRELLWTLRQRALRQPFRE